MGVFHCRAIMLLECSFDKSHQQCCFTYAGTPKYYHSVVIGILHDCPVRHLDVNSGLKAERIGTSNCVAILNHVKLNLDSISMLTSARKENTCDTSEYTVISKRRQIYARFNYPNLSLTVSISYSD